MKICSPRTRVGHGRARASSLVLALSTLLAACGAQPVLYSPAKVAEAPRPAPTAAVVALPDGPAAASGVWVGAAALTDKLARGARTVELGVWVDVPAGLSKVRPKTAVALAIDTSGSMAGPKMESAKSAARDLVSGLADGDIVSVYAFSDRSHELIAPVVLSTATRREVLAAISTLRPSGGTNMFDGLRMAEHSASRAPESHPVKRVVLVSDGHATVGPTSVEMLSTLAGRSGVKGAQMTAIGVGLDYDEATLNQLAIRSSGRLYHLAEPTQLASILSTELGLLKKTAATGAVLEVKPAPGVRITGLGGSDGQRRADGAIEVPLGSMFEGQHRELLVRVTLDEAASLGERPLASVRLRFGDPSDFGVERVHEVVARAEVVSDAAVAAASINARAQAVATAARAAELAQKAAGSLNEGKAELAVAELERAEADMKRAATMAKRPEDKARVEAQAGRIAEAKQAAKAAAAAPPAARPAAARGAALKSNDVAMDAMGF